MSLRSRLALGISGLVLATLVVVWLVVSGRILRPFESELQERWADRVARIAAQLDDGVDPDALTDTRGLSVVPVPRGPHRSHDRVQRGEYTVVFARGPGHAFVQTRQGWIEVRPEFDARGPRRRFRTGLLLLAGVVLGGSLLLAAASLRPLDRTREAMARVAAGQLDHRLPEEGPRELAEVARTFNAMTAKVQELLRSERQLMAGISHDLRTPLTRLRLELELLRDEVGEHPRLARMEDDLGEVDDLLGEVLAIRRLQLGEAVVEREDVDLRALVEEVLAAEPLPEHDITVQGEATCALDPRLVRRLVANLHRNAGEHTPAGTRLVWTLTPETLVLADDGPGVPDAQLSQLFEPFFRGEASRSRQTGGSGLGLMIVRQIAVLHGGEVRARTSAHGGLEIAVYWASPRS